MIRVMVADDHPVVRLGLRALIEAEPDMMLVGEASDGLDAVRRASELEPDVVVLDLQMPGLSGAEAAASIGKRLPDTRCVILTTQEEPSDAREQLVGQGVGLVAAQAVGSTLTSAIREAAGQDPHDIPRAQSDAVPASGTGDRLEWLSNRERQVAVMLARGLTAREIGEAIHLSHKTVGTYRGRIYQKLGVHSRAEITQAVLDAGLLAFDKSA